jgi:hypothetical protein
MIFKNKITISAINKVKKNQLNLRKIPKMSDI